MKMHTLQPAEGAVRDVKRLGRGIGSGTGKTSGKGHKGQEAAAAYVPASKAVKCLFAVVCLNAASPIISRKYIQS